MPAPKRINTPRRMNAALAPTMFPHMVTLYQTETFIDDKLNETTVNHITVLDGVLLIASRPQMSVQPAWRARTQSTSISPLM